MDRNPGVARHMLKPSVGETNVPADRYPPITIPEYAGLRACEQAVTPFSGRTPAVRTRGEPSCRNARDG